MTTKDYQRKSPLVIFLTYFKNHKKLFAIDVACAMLIAAIDLAFPLVTRSALYDMLPGKMYKTFFIVMVAVILSYVLRSFLNYIVAYYGHTFGIRVEADIRRDLFRHMQELSFDFYDSNRTGKLMARLTSDLFELTELAHHGPEDLITSVLTIIGALIVMVKIQWRLAVVVALMIPVFLVVVMTMRKRMSRASAAAKEKTGHINQEIESSLSGFRTARAFGNEAVENARFGAANEIYKTSKREFHKAMGMFHSSVEFFLCSLNVVIIGVGGWNVMQGRMDYRDLLTFTLYISSFVGPMRKLSGFSEMFANGFAGLNRFVDIMRTEPTIQDAPDAVALKDVKGNIKVENVTFAYEAGFQRFVEGGLHGRQSAQHGEDQLGGGGAERVHHQHGNDNGQSRLYGPQTDGRTEFYFFHDITEKYTIYQRVKKPRSSRTSPQAGAPQGGLSCPPGNSPPGDPPNLRENCVF